MEATLTLLQGYQRLLALSNVMLKLAQRGQWDELIGHEMNYVCMVESVARDGMEAHCPPYCRRRFVRC